MKLSLSIVLLSSLMLLAACDSDRSTGGGGVRVLGSIDTGVPARMDATSTNNPDGSGGSGVDSSKYLDELTAAEVTALCAYTLQAQGGPGEKQCTEGLTVTVNSQAECEAEYAAGGPHCQVMLVEACMVSLNGDACDILSTAECATLLQCVLGGGGGEDAGEADAAEGPPDAGE